VIRSPDGRAYVHWGFYRNNRQCGTFNATPFILAEARREAENELSDSDMVRNMSVDKRMKQLDAKAASDRAPVTDAMPTPKDAEVQHTANKWIVGLTSGNAGKMQAVSAVPFRVGENVAANAASEVGALYRPLIQANRGRRPAWRVFTAASFRKRFDALPPGFEQGKPVLLMVVQVAGENLTLELARHKDGTFKVQALHR
jgi:hypothetical protein